MYVVAGFSTSYALARQRPSWAGDSKRFQAGALRPSTYLTGFHKWGNPKMDG